jgi:23S rRNA-/tRNA-specific pseudouridylate synthase|tara:strand:+ start:1559 stop:1807 length:249 start_codon:yes stop_codon:yes gene_type:complete
MVLSRTGFGQQMSKPKNKKRKVKKQYLAGTSGELRKKRKAALKKLNKDNKGSGVLPGDKKGGKFVGSKKESKHNKKFRRMYG